MSGVPSDPGVADVESSGNSDPHGETQMGPLRETQAERLR